MGLSEWYAKTRKKVTGKAPTTNIIPEIERERGMQGQVAAAYAGKPQPTRQSKAAEFGSGLMKVFGGIGQMGANFGSSNIMGGGRGLKNGGFSGYTPPKMDFGFGIGTQRSSRPRKKNVKKHAPRARSRGRTIIIRT